jgi:cystathionine beta-lyase/cystathionine gamma-synthase
MPEKRRFETDLIHAGQAPDPTTGAVVTPIHPTTTYAQPELGRHKGFEYSRTGNPTRKALEENIAALEGGVRGFAFASGMAATTTVTHLLKAGDHVVCEENVYGGTIRYFNKVASNFGLEFTFVDASNPENVKRAMKADTKFVFLETPTNPNLKITDLAAVARVAHEGGALCVVDNTFASPYLQRPLQLGADVVIHSATKYLGGHSDVVGGLVTTSKPEVAERLAFLQNAMGAILGPFDAWLVLRGIKTLAVRMEQQSRNAQQIAEWLVSHPKVKSVAYPGLKDHPQHDLAKRQMRTPGAMVSFELKSGLKGATEAVKRLQVWTLAESLGAVESLVCHPVTMTHASVPPEIRARSGVTEGLVRLSVGLEAVEDLVADLDQALKAA